MRRLLDVRLAAETGHFLGTLPKLDLPATGATLDPAPGDAVGPWRLLRELGAGGMGTVWLAERHET